MAARNEGVEKRPASVNTDEETRQDVDALVDGIDDATRDQIVRATTTRERTTVAKRGHEPLDLADADEDQPDEEANGPRAAEVNPGKDPITSKSPNKVSEKQIKADSSE